MHAHLRMTLTLHAAIVADMIHFVQDRLAPSQCSPLHVSSMSQDDEAVSTQQGQRAFAAHLPVLGEEPSSSAVHAMGNCLSLNMGSSNGRSKGQAGSGGSSGHHRSSRQLLVRLLAAAWILAGQSFLWHALIQCLHGSCWQICLLAAQAEQHHLCLDGS